MNKKARPNYMLVKRYAISSKTQIDESQLLEKVISCKTFFE